MNLARPTLVEAIALQRAGKGVLSVERRRVVWRYVDSTGRGVTETFPGIYASDAKAREAIATARARMHLSGEAAA